MVRLFIYLLAIPWACGMLVSWFAIEPMPPATEARSLNHWTTRAVPVPSLSVFSTQYCAWLNFSELSHFSHCFHSIFLLFQIKVPEPSLSNPSMGVSWRPFSPRGLFLGTVGIGQLLCTEAPSLPLGVTASHWATWRLQSSGWLLNSNGLDGLAWWLVSFLRLFLS